MKKGWIAAAIVVAVTLFGGWYWGSPRYTLHQMRAAAEAGDTDKLASYIDFPAVRASFKEELKAAAAAEMSKAKGMEALGAMMAMNMIDPMVDGMVTPATMRKVFVANKNKGPEGITKVDGASKDLEIKRDSFDQFRLRQKGEDAGNGLVFTRHGLGWQLSGMRMPN